MFLQGQEAVC